MYTDEKAVAQVLDIDTSKGELRKVKRKMKPPAPPPSSDPKQALRILVQQHKALTKVCVANRNMSTDKKFGDEVVPCRLPDAQQAEVQGFADIMSKAAKKLETAMLRELRRIPVYAQYLKHVNGVGPVLSAYLVAFVDISRAVKPSNLIRYCGYGCVEGKSERAASGKVRQFNQDLKIKLYVAMSAMRMNGRGEKSKPNKYLKLWDDYKHRAEHSGELAAKGKGFVDAKGRRKATDAFLRDLYVAWRALEGLPVWPCYYEGKLGVKHGGVPLPIEALGPRTITFAEALDVIRSD